LDVRKMEKRQNNVPKTELVHGVTERCSDSDYSEF